MLVTAALLLAFVGYTYAGYPVLVAIAAKLSPARRQPDSSWRPTISVLCSVYNGTDFIADKLQTLVAQDYPSDKIELLFYDDGSTDGSAALLEGLRAKHPRMKVVIGDGRKGKPTALVELAKHSTGEVLVLTDIRQRLSKRALAELTAALADPQVGCAGGLLVLEGSSGAGAYWKYEGFIRRCESRFRSVVGVSGSLYAIRREDFPAVPADIILDDLFVPMTVRRAGKQVVLVDDARAFDRAADDGREFGRKARTLAGNYQLLARMPSLLVPLINPSWFEFVSHKVFRLLCPWALMALLVVSTIGTASSQVMHVLLALQCAAYALALAGGVAGPLGKLARTFVVMNVAAVVGLWRFLSGRQQITW